MGNARKPKIIQKNNLKKWLVFTVLVLGCLSHFGLYIYENSEKFFARDYHTRYEEYKKVYYGSQYVQKKPAYTMVDEQFESFAGGAFLKGMNPILIVHDHPPLGRYLISLSILVFDNEHTIMIPLLFLSLLGIYLIAQVIYKNIFLSLIPVAIFANEPLFFNKIVYTPLPEPIQLPFIIWGFYFFIRAITMKKSLGYFFLTSVMIGIVISTRFFVTGVVMVMAMSAFFILHKRFDKTFFQFLLMLPISVLILLATYTRTMMDGYNVIKTLGIQKYILAYHKSKFVLPFSFWELILFNRWHTWWGTKAILSDSQWMFFWPISVMGTVSYAFLFALKKIRLSDAEKILLLWVFLYTGVLSTGYTSVRYFLPILPFFYILTGSFLLYIVKKYYALYKI